MHNTLSLVGHTEVGQSKLLYILFESNALQSAIGFFDERRGGFEVFPRGGGYVVVYCDKRAVFPAHIPVCQSKAFESLRTRYLGAMSADQCDL